MREEIRLVRPSDAPESPIAALQPFGFWCRYESIGIDEDTRAAMIDGTCTPSQEARFRHLLKIAKDALIAFEPASRRAS